MYLSTRTRVGVLYFGHLRCGHHPGYVVVLLCEAQDRNRLLLQVLWPNLQRTYFVDIVRFEWWYDVAWRKSDAARFRSTEVEPRDVLASVYQQLTLI